MAYRSLRLKQRNKWENNGPCLKHMDVIGSFPTSIMDTTSLHLMSNQQTQPSYTRQKNKMSPQNQGSVCNLLKFNTVETRKEDAKAISKSYSTSPEVATRPGRSFEAMQHVAVPLWPLSRLGGASVIVASLHLHELVRCYRWPTSRR